MRSIVIPLLIELRSSFRSRAELQVEIAALHQQLACCSGVSEPDLGCDLSIDSSGLGWPGWRRALVIVQPQTVVAWHRKGFRLY